MRVTQGGYPGIGRATEGLALGLLAGEMSHQFVCLFAAGRPAPRSLLRRIRAPHRVLFVDAGLRTIRDQALLRYWLRGTRIDLYHAPYFGMAVFPGVPYVVAVHDTIPIRFPEYWPAYQVAIIRAWQKRVTRHAACVITGSNAAASDLVEHYAVAVEKVVVSPWGVVEWGVAATAPESVVEHPYLLCVSTNKPHKNLVRLVHAYREASASQAAFPDLVIAGGWSDKYPQAAEAIEAANAGALPGAVRHVRNPNDAQLRYLYEHAESFVFPSLYEGFGLPVLEAMQAGLPVAASNTPAVAEVCGDAALSFDPLDITSIAGAVRRLATDPDARRHFRAAGLAHVKRYSWSDTVSQTLRAYEVALCA